MNICKRWRPFILDKVEKNQNIHFTCLSPKREEPEEVRDQRGEIGCREVRTKGDEGAESGPLEEDHVLLGLAHHLEVRVLRLVREGALSVM